MTSCNQNQLTFSSPVKVVPRGEDRVAITRKELEKTPEGRQVN